MKAISLETPPNGFLENLRERTSVNDHSGARWAVASWIYDQLRAHGGTMADSDYREANSFYCVFEAIATIHAELGCLPKEVLDLRHRRTEEMLEFIGRANTEAAKAIRNVL